MPRIPVALILVHLLASEYVAQAEEGCPFNCDSGREIDPRTTVTYRMPCDPSAPNPCGPSMQCISQCGVYKKAEEDDEEMDLRLSLLPFIVLGIFMVCCCGFCKALCGRLSKKLWAYLRDLGFFDDEPSPGPKERDPDDDLERCDSKEELPPNFRELLESCEGPVKTRGYQTPSATASTASPYPSPGPSSLAPSTITSANVSETGSEQGSEHAPHDARRGRGRRSRSEGAPRRSRQKDASQEHGGRQRPKSARSGTSSSRSSRP